MIDQGFCKQLLETFSSNLNLPIFLVDKKGDISKQHNPSFIMDLICSTPQGKDFCDQNRKEIVHHVSSPMLYPFVFGLSWVCSPLNEGVLLLGPIRTGDISLSNISSKSAELGLDHEEIHDEIKKIPIENIQTLTKTTAALADVLQNRGSQEHKRSERIDRLEFLQRLADAFASSLNIQEIMRSALQYIVETFHLENCSITLFDDNQRYAYRIVPDALKQAETAIRNHLESVKSFVSISDVSTNFMFETVDGIKDVKTALMAYPLMAERNIIGMMIIYQDKFLDEDLEMMPLLVRRLAQSLTTSSSFRKMRDFAVTDKLTNLYNRSYFNEFFKKEVERGRRSEKAVSLAIFDIDDFKMYNDSFGHPIGDQILVDLGKIINDNIRSFDTACRYGGEEFCIIMPEVSSEEAFAISERLRSKIEEYRFGAFEDRFKPVTISVGLVTCMNSSMSSGEMLDQADKNLYQAKSAGKNKVFSSIVLDKTLGVVDVQKANSLYTNN